MVKKIILTFSIFSMTFLFTATRALADNVSITSTVPPTTVTFSGVGAAGSTVTFKDSLVTIGTTTINGSGTFSKTINVNSGLHTFQLSLTDTVGRTTPDTVFSGVDVPVHMDTPVSNIHLPTTIALTKNTINSGESVGVLGRAAPGSTVHVFLNGTEHFSAVVGAGSDWEFDFSSGYNVGNNTLYAYLTRTGLANSVNSFTKSLQVTSCRRSDLNCDTFVNLTDFSIMLYHWNSNYPPADTNHDGTVGIIDFSIMLFDWTG